MLRKVLIGALMLTALVAGPAAAQYPDFAITPGTVNVGGNATFQGSGCAPGSTVTITIDGKVVATVTADASGDYNGSFVADMAPGTYTVTVTPVATWSAPPPLTVRSVAVTPPPPGGGTGGTSLPRTGSNTNTMALVGAGLLLLGGGAILATRKRTIA
jgi:LPXTG-motif cell wall-anchored protein